MPKLWLILVTESPTPTSEEFLFTIVQNFNLDTIVEKLIKKKKKKKTIFEMKWISVLCSKFNLSELTFSHMQNKSNIIPQVQTYICKMLFIAKLFAITKYCNQPELPVHRL